MANGRVVGFLIAVGLVVGWSMRSGWAEGDDDQPAGEDHPAAGEDHPAAGEDHPAAGEDHPAAGEDHPVAGDHPAVGEDHPAAGEDHPTTGEDQPGDHPAAEEQPAPPPTDSDHDGTPDSLEDNDHDGTPDSLEDNDHDGTPDSLEDRDHDGTPDSQEAAAAAAATDDEGEPYIDADADGDGVVEPGEREFEQEIEAEHKALGIPDKIDDSALDQRDNATELLPSLTAAQFRKLVQLARQKVLPRLEMKMAKKQATRMMNFTYLVCGFSLLGVFLLLTPLFLRKKYPGQGGLLFKYSALAAVTWLVTVNLFGGVLYGMRSAQGALSSLTNPQLAIAGGLFDTLDRNAEDYLVMGKELFAPTLEQLKGNSDDQPAATLIENGKKIVGDAKVFTSMAHLFKKVDWLFAMLPIVLLGVTLILFALAIKPTLIEIIKLPTKAATGDPSAARAVMGNSMRRIVGELKATVATVGVLAVLTLLSAFVLGRIVGPALDGLLGYFSLAVNYLQFQPGASSGLVFCALFGVIFFLVLNLATLILSMAFFLGKCQKIFQQRFNDQVPISRHTRFFKWGIPSVLLVQVFPWLFVFVAEKGLSAINDKLLAGVTSADNVNWKALMLAGPLFLVFGYIVVFWAARGVKAIRFLQSYKVKAALQPASPAAGT